MKTTHPKATNPGKPAGLGLALMLTGAALAQTGPAPTHSIGYRAALQE